MCIIQCVDCPCCSRLRLVPLKTDYFDGDIPRPFPEWPRVDLVHRFRNAGRIHFVVEDYICVNPYCIRRHPEYRPLLRELIGGKCESAFCSEGMCRLVGCDLEEFCQYHFPGYEHLMRRPPSFRVRIFEHVFFRNQNALGHAW